MNNNAGYSQEIENLARRLLRDRDFQRESGFTEEHLEDFLISYSEEDIKELAKEFQVK